MEQKKAAELLAENIKTIFAYSLSRVSHMEDAQDLAGDIILAILQSVDQIRDDNAFYGFIWAIASNTYKKFLKKRARNGHSEIDETIASDEDFVSKLAEESEINTLRCELSLLSREYRECTVAYYINGLSCAETASKLGISLEMVKYYLFKTRKILKEGIAMEREFGEKSYNPAKFEFVTIFSGIYNAEYRNLFNRKLPGNILLSAYYTPMTIRELSIELGVASAYLEDEILLLEKYKLITTLPGGKYQTNLLIFTESYTEEFRKSAVPLCSDALVSVYDGISKKLDAIKKISFIGSDFEENRLLWNLTYILLHYGHSKFEKKNNKDEKKDEIYRGATGINYGIDYDEYCDEFSCNSFAGYSRIDDNYAAAFANFGILPEKNWYVFSNNEASAAIKAVKNQANSSFVILTKPQLTDILNLFEEELDKMSDLYELLSKKACEIMRVHAPKSVVEMIDKIICSTIYFRTIGLIGACIVKSGTLPLPDFDSPAAAYIYKTNDKELAKENCMT